MAYGTGIYNNKGINVTGFLTPIFFLIDLRRHQALRRTLIRHRVNHYMPCGH